MRAILAGVVALAVAAWADAHMVYVLLQGDKGVVVFSDTLAADENVPVAKVAGTKLVLRDAEGKVTELKLTKDNNTYTVPLPDRKPGVVFGTCEYGVLAKGEGKPFLLKYHPKLIVDDPFAKNATLGDKAYAEIVPVKSGAKVRFRFVAQGKPQAKAEVHLRRGDGTKSVATTDDDGMTEGFAAEGRYGAYAKYAEAVEGEAGGTKYGEVRHYATLVCDFGMAK